MGLLLPVLIPFIFHWYEGAEPPLEEFALNVSKDPAQFGFVPEIKLIEVAGETVGVTVM